jgi:hypothetical protein
MALDSITTGDSNVALGYKALDTISTGESNTAIGAFADVASSDLNNATAVGYEASVTESNTIQLGNPSVANVKTSGSITLGEITIPNTDGSPNQVLKTDGYGTLRWASDSSVDGFFPVPYAMANWKESRVPFRDSKVQYNYHFLAEENMTVNKITVWGWNEAGSRDNHWQCNQYDEIITLGLYRGSYSNPVLIGQGSGGLTNQYCSGFEAIEISITPELGQDLSITKLEPLYVGLYVRVPGFYPLLSCTDDFFSYSELANYNIGSDELSLGPWGSSWHCKFVALIH